MNIKSVRTARAVALSIHVCALLLVSTGCATRSRNLMLGVGIGAAAGGTAGYFIGKNAAAKKKAEESLGAQKSDAPILTKPEVRAVWEPDRIEDDKFISGHFIYIIQKPSTWSKP